MSQDQKMCASCNGTGRLYTSSWDDEGFPCPECQRCTCGLSEGHPEEVHFPSCPISSSRRYTEQTTEHAAWCSAEHEGKCLDHQIAKVKGGTASEQGERP